MTERRPAIPEDVKRQVRQRCGFGCIICGVPVYHYDHIDEYHQVGTHAVENLTLLCGLHHDLKTRGQLPTDVVRARNEHPHNGMNKATAAHSLFYLGPSAEILAGGNRVTIPRGGASAIRVDGQSLVDFEMVDGHLVLNLDLCDRDGASMLRVRRNELVHSTHLWDYEYTGQRLTIREQPGHVYLSILFEADRHRVVIDKGLVSHNGVELMIGPRAICILNNRTLLSGSSVSGSDTAIAIGDDPRRDGPEAIHVEIDRGPFDRDAAVAWARQKMKAARSEPGRQPISRSSPTVDLATPTNGLTWWSVACAPFSWSQASFDHRSGEAMRRRAR